MKVLYGQRGQPIGSIEGDAVFWKDGVQIAQVVDDHLFEIEDGTWIGSYVRGVIYNGFDAPQAFSDSCAPGIPLLPPNIRTVLPPRVPLLGNDVSGLAAKHPPQFLRDALPSTNPNQRRDGYFS